MMTALSPDRLDRAAGVLVGQACGDALGVPYEFAPVTSGAPEMIGGGLGPYEPGQWSDDTEMAVCIARVAATGADLTSTPATDEVARAYADWLRAGARDVGTHTRAVLTVAASAVTGTAPVLAFGQRLRDAAAERHTATGHTAGNGALMRTGVVGLSRLADREATAAAARAMATLTHPDPLAADSCVLWSEAVRVAVLDARLDLVGGLDLLPAERRDRWAEWIVAAQDGSAPLRPNGFTVTALQAAWAAVRGADQGSPEERVVLALHRAVWTGDDTDTVAAITGALAGARFGRSAIPERWQAVVHGWPGLRAADLDTLARRTASAGWTAPPPDRARH